MALIDWSDEMSVGVKEIDAQHQKLVKLINELNEAMSEGKSKQVLGDILDELIEYTDTHFSTEENYMSEFDFDGLEEHKRAHAGFVKKVTDFQSKFEEGKLLLSVKVMNFLKDWLTDHIAGMDQKYSECFLEHGLS